MNIPVKCGERLISPADVNLRYPGRIGGTAEAPFFIFPCSSLEMKVAGRTLRVALDNQHSYFENRLGVIVNGEQSAILLEKGEQVIDLSHLLTADVNDVLLFKRQDCCHAYILHGFVVEGELLALPERPARRMEVYGDSVSAGEVSEAEFACAQPDPQGHNGLYSNSWLSYSWQAARLLNAELHDIATGGMALLDKTGYFYGPDYIGLESAWGKVNYYPPFGESTPWDFTRWTPHVVVVAIGQNDHNPVNIMAEDYNSDASAHWRAEYRRFLGLLREKYPRAHIVCTTTILGHDPAWDRAIDECVKATGDGRIHHFLYSKNGCGTPGHIRGSEAAVMARELADFVNSLPDVWKDDSLSMR